MYVKATIKDRQNNIYEVEAENGFDCLHPLSYSEQLKHALATNSLLLSFSNRLRKYANKDHSIIKIETDNLTLFKKFSEKGHPVKYMPRVIEG